MAAEWPPVVVKGLDPNPRRDNWWQRRSTPAKVAVLAVVLFGAVGVLAGVSQSFARFASPEREMLTRVDTAAGTWNGAASVVMASVEDSSLDPRQFTTVTATARAQMHAAVDRMEGVVPTSDATPFGAALREDVASYRDRLTAIDNIALAVAASDSAGASSGLDQLLAAVARAKRAYTTLADVGRPFLTDEEVQSLQNFDGS